LHGSQNFWRDCTFIERDLLHFAPLFVDFVVLAEMLPTGGVTAKMKTPAFSVLGHELNVNSGLLVSDIKCI
jgi:hypothetical protein